MRSCDITNGTVLNVLIGHMTVTVLIPDKSLYTIILYIIHHIIIYYT